jgi:heme O synthase-like polyprenyltransferase
VYLGGALALGIALALTAAPLITDRTTRAARRLLLASVVYLPALLALMALDRRIPIR